MSEKTTKGLLITGPQGSGKTRLADRIASTYRKTSVLRIEGSFEHLPWGIGNYRLIIIDGISSKVELFRLIEHFPERYRQRAILVTQQPSELIKAEAKGLQNWNVRDLQIKQKADVS